MVTHAFDSQQQNQAESVDSVNPTLIVWIKTENKHGKYGQLNLKTNHAC